MKFKIALLAITLYSAMLVESIQAHFLWLVPMDESGEKVSLFFSEGPEPDNPKLLKRVSSARAVPYRSSKPEDAIGFAFDESDSRLVAQHAGASAWTLNHTFGTFGNDEKNLLVYSASSVACRRMGMSSKDVVSLPRQGYSAEPSFDGRTLSILVWDDDKPAADVAIELQSPNDQRSLRTDSTGKLLANNVTPGVYAIRLVKSDETPGEYEGVAYKAVKKYTTVSFIVPNLQGTSMTESDKSTTLPEAITSFGATSIGDAIFVFGGHMGDAHSYSLEEQFNKLVRLDLKSGKEWETVAEGPRVQGNALVAFENSVILVGGFSAENTKGEKSRLVSKRTVQKFDLQLNKWIDMPSLPEPRSSMDATVLDGYVYAIGGWSMTGDSNETEWLKTAWKLNLNNPESSWQAIAEPPFQRRALAVVAHSGRIFVIGGMNAEGGPTTESCAYDPMSNSWKTLGSIAGVPMNGFGAAATVLEGKLLVSTLDGSIQEFQDESASWSIVGQIETGRFFHRMLPVSKTTVGILGGANMEVGKFRETDFIKFQTAP